MTVDKLRTELEPLRAKLRRTSPASSAIFAAACVNPDGPEAADAITALLLRIEGLTEALEAIKEFADAGETLLCWQAANDALVSQ